MELTRNIDVITSEIIVIRDHARRVFWQSVIDIGRRLEEAKELVPQGEWTNYLTGVLGFKPSTAQNYMRIAREMGDGQIALDGQSAEDLFGELSYSQLLPLLGLTEDDRRELAENNDLREMSSREIEKLTKDYKAAKQASDIAARRASELEDKLEKSQKAQEKASKAEEDAEAARVAAEERAKALEGRVNELMERQAEAPLEGTAALVPDEEILERERGRVRAEMQAAIEQAEARAAEAAAKLEKAKSPALAKANFLFGELQHAISRLGDALAELEGEQPDTAGKLRQVLREKVPEMCGVI